MIIHPVRKISAVPAASWLRLLACFVVVAIQACGGDSNEPTDIGALAGTVTDIQSGQTLDGVNLVIAGRTGQSDLNGHYRIEGVPAGQQLLTATRDGYLPYTAEPIIPAGGEETLDIRLAPGGGIPDAITRLSASSGREEGSVLLEWETESPTTRYNLYWSTSPGVTPATGTKIAFAVPPYLHTGLTPGATYYYVVTVGELDESAPSPEVHAVARGSIAVRIISPTASGFVDTPVSVEAAITSAFSLSEVTAQAGETSAAMTFDAPNQRWRALLPLEAFDSPVTVLIRITAKDVIGNVGEGSISARFDRHPAVIVTDPANGVVVQPTAAIRVTCSDDSSPGCVSVTVLDADRLDEDIVLLRSQGNVNSTFSLAQYEGRRVFLEIRATDNAGQVTAVPRYLFVETTPGLTEVADAGSGILIDADATRLLVNNTAERAHGGHGGDTLRIVDRATHASTTVFTGESTVVNSAKLTPQGALLVTQRFAYNITQVREFRSGVLTTLADVDVVPGFEVAGDFAMWVESGSGLGESDLKLVRRDLTAGTSQNLATLVYAVDLAPNGDVAYVKGGEVFRFRDGSTQQITENVAAELYARGVKTDGTRIVQVVGPLCCDTGPFQVVLLDPAGDVVLAPGSGVEDLLMNAGWIALTRPDIGGVAQVWVRSPGGTETQVSFFGHDSRPVLLNNDGGLALEDAHELFSNLYRASPTSGPAKVAGGGAEPIYIDGVLHAMVGASLFRVN